MTIQEIQNYFAERGGKNGVKSQDAVWTLLVRHYNADEENKRKRKRLSMSCGACRATAYKWLIQQV